MFFGSPLSSLTVQRRGRQGVKKQTNQMELW
ncbi:hypothetical protein OESDEN_10286 [Oesophagostomum dentatum]|uniref:Uncharacterized protein n=1 Tax=Oesophagostomum dentatum TaxID=61180 RepID=A0A0B1T151_OESDE|nr:hypothetical protein OESDEN_10286 [Oesophagostomum dentatum]